MNNFFLIITFCVNSIEVASKKYLYENQRVIKQLIRRKHLVESFQFIDEETETYTAIVILGREMEIAVPFITSIRVSEFPIISEYSESTIVFTIHAT